MSHIVESESSGSEARERVLQAAERLFAQKGYTAVKLRDIAAEVRIRHASLYHHVPGGKEQLFIEVTERSIQRHAEGMRNTIQAAEVNVRAQLYAIADWMLSQPPMDLVRMTHSDMPAMIDKIQAQRLLEMMFFNIMAPIHEVLRQAQLRGEIDHPDLGLVGGGFLGLVQSFHAIPDYVVQGSRAAMAHRWIDVMLDGLLKHD